MSWKRLHRKLLIEDPFLVVYEDQVELPNGSVIDNYSIVQKPDYVIIVALDRHNNLITIDEYKYAIDKTLHVLPAGHINSGENPLTTARRELSEETGYSGGVWTYLGEFYDYPSKDSHKAHFIKGVGVVQQDTQHLDATEAIKVRILPLPQLKEEVRKGEWVANSSLAALAAAGILS